RGQVRVDLVAGAGDDLALRLEHELVADLVGGGCGLRCELGIDDELHLAGVVAEVDEDEAAVVAARVGPARDGHGRADMLGPRLAAVEVSPAHALSVAARSSSETMVSPDPRRRTVASIARTVTTVAAPT